MPGQLRSVHYTTQVQSEILGYLPWVDVPPLHKTVMQIWRDLFDDRSLAFVTLNRSFGQLKPRPPMGR